MGIVILVGVLVGPAWDWRGLVVAALLFLLIRPVAALLTLRRSQLGTALRNLVAWLGICGIGSLYYLAYAAGEGLGQSRAEEVSSIVLTVVAASIVVHELSVILLLR